MVAIIIIIVWYSYGGDNIDYINNGGGDSTINNLNTHPVHFKDIKEQK